MPVTALEASSDVLQRARDLLTLDTSHVPKCVCEDLRRAALVFGVASIDTYMHWAIGKRTFIKRLPSRLAQVAVPFGSMLEIANASVEARKKGHPNRPQVRVRNVLNEKLLTMTFQKPADIEKGLLMIGVSNCWQKIAKVVVPAATASELKDRLGKLAHRRNKIAHEGDLTRQQRHHQLKRDEIKSSYVRVELDWIESFVKALDELGAAPA